MTKVPWNQLTTQSKIAVVVGVVLIVIGFATLLGPLIAGGVAFCYGGSRNWFDGRNV